MFTHTISRKTLKALDLVAEAHMLPPATYLAGGTAAALHLGHRYSYDLDFFTSRRFDAQAIVRRFKKIKGFSLEKTSWQTILGYIDAVQCTLFYYQYPLLFPCHDFHGVAIADLRDVAAMKIAALSDRGAKRDFVDLYVIAKVGGVSVEEAITYYGKKFGVLESNRVHIMKSLTFFEDAESQNMPRMVTNVTWREVKKFFKHEASQFIRNE